MTHHRAGPEPSQVILISTHSEDDYARLIAASPAVGFLSKIILSAGAIRHLLGLRGGGDLAGPRSASLEGSDHQGRCRDPRRSPGS